MSFDSLGLSDSLLRSLDRLGYAAATPVQREAIPLILQGLDLQAAAETGSGKTAAFALPILQRLSGAGEGDRRSPRALALVPTRELAAQVGEAFALFGSGLESAPRTLVVFGGVGYEAQMAAARAGADVVVATPGRLLDLVERGALDLGGVETLTLDEADRLLALGFADELNAILARLPARRQNLLFSATFPEAVTALADALLTDPRKLQLESESGQVAGIAQRAIEVERDARTGLLRHLLESEGWARALVFVATKRRADNVVGKLRKRGIRAAALHGDLSQEQRSRALEDFKASKSRVLLATDVAARGLDIVGLPCVVNYDLPRSPTDYVHRIGRTGRAGESGVALSFIGPEDDAHFRLIEKRAGVSLPRERIAGFAPAQWNPEDFVTTGAPVKGKRKSKKDKLREAAARAGTPGPAASDPEAPPLANDPWAVARERLKGERGRD